MKTIYLITALFFSVLFTECAHAISELQTCTEESNIPKYRYKMKKKRKNRPSKSAIQSLKYKPQKVNKKLKNQGWFSNNRRTLRKNSFRLSRNRLKSSF